MKRSNLTLTCTIFFSGKYSACISTQDFTISKIFSDSVGKLYEFIYFCELSDLQFFGNLSLQVLCIYIRDFNVYTSKFASSKISQAYKFSKSWMLTRNWIAYFFKIIFISNNNSDIASSAFKYYRDSLGVKDVVCCFILNLLSEYYRTFTLKTIEACLWISVFHWRISQGSHELVNNFNSSSELTFNNIYFCRN